MYEQQRSTGKRDGDGELIMKTMQHPAPVSVEVQHLENTYLKQNFAMARDKEVSAAAAHSVKLKHEAYATQCDAVNKTLSRIDAVVSKPE